MSIATRFFAMCLAMVVACLGVATPAAAAVAIDLGNSTTVNGQPRAITSYVFDLKLFESKVGSSSTGFPGLPPGGSFGKVTVTKGANGTLNFLVQLASGTVGNKSYGVSFHETRNVQHEAFVFALKGDPNVVISGFGPQFSAYSQNSGDMVRSPPFNDAEFRAGLSCVRGKGCKQGFSGIDTLSFNVAAPGKNLNFSDIQGFLYGMQTTFFAADVAYRDINGNIFTGNVGAVLVSGYVPEPETWVSMILGFGVLGSAMRRKMAIGRGDRLAAA